MWLPFDCICDCVDNDSQGLQDYQVKIYMWCMHTASDEAIDLQLSICNM